MSVTFVEVFVLHPFVVVVVIVVVIVLFVLLLPCFECLMAFLCYSTPHPHPTRPVPCSSRGASPGADAGGQPLDQLRPHPETDRAAADEPPSAAVLPAPGSVPAADVPPSAAGTAAAAVPSPAARHPATLERAERQPPRPRRQNPDQRLCVRACRSATHHYSK